MFETNKILVVFLICKCLLAKYNTCIRLNSVILVMLAGLYNYIHSTVCSKVKPYISNAKKLYSVPILAKIKLT